MRELSLGQAVEVLRAGGVIVFPSDTVWAVGALVSNEQGVEKFYRVKKREKSKPSQLLVADMAMAELYGEFNQKARDLAGAYWPGALTVVVQAGADEVFDLVRGGGNSVGLRAPNHELLLSLIREVDEAIVASSANVAGGVPPMVYEKVMDEILSTVDGVLMGVGGRKTSSTVIEVKGDDVEVLRQGEVLV